MKHGRTSASEAGAVHALTREAAGQAGRPWRGLCGMRPTSPPLTLSQAADGRFTGRWHQTPEPVTCARCLLRMEKLAEQALADEAIIAVVIEAARRATEHRVRSFRKLWPALSRPVADLLRHRGIQLGDGWLGPASTVTVNVERGRL